MNSEDAKGGVTPTRYRYFDFAVIGEQRYQAAPGAIWHPQLIVEVFSCEGRGARSQRKVPRNSRVGKFVCADISTSSGE